MLIDSDFYRAKLARGDFNITSSCWGEIRANLWDIYSEKRWHMARWGDTSPIIIPEHVRIRSGRLSNSLAVESRIVGYRTSDSPSVRSSVRCCSTQFYIGRGTIWIVILDVYTYDNVYGESGIDWWRLKRLLMGQTSVAHVVLLHANKLIRLVVWQGGIKKFFDRSW